MVGLNGVRVVEVGDGAGEFDGFHVDTGRDVEFAGSGVEQVFGF